MAHPVPDPTEKRERIMRAVVRTALDNGRVLVPIDDADAWGAVAAVPAYTIASLGPLSSNGHLADIVGRQPAFGFRLDAKAFHVQPEFRRHTGYDLRPIEFVVRAGAARRGELPVVCVAFGVEPLPFAAMARRREALAAMAREQ